MTTMKVVSMAPNEYGVEVEEGHETTAHKVRVSEGFLDDLLLTDVDHEVIVRETIDFLLEREPATSILPEFSLDVVSSYFPEYEDEIRVRLM